jgi:hypothetical protein
MAGQSDGVVREAAKAAYEPPEFVEYGQASSLIQTNPAITTPGDGGAPGGGSDYVS